MTQELINFECNKERLIDYISNCSGSKILLITGKSSYIESGAARLINEVIDRSKWQVLRYQDFDSNPNVKDLNDGLNQAKSFSPDLFIAIGGGSVIDMGKLIRYFSALSGDFFSKNQTQISAFKPLIAIPSTAGTGSEATHFAVLYDENKEKKSIASQSILPDVAVLASSLTNDLPAYITACSGFDALAQAIEAYWNINATTESDSYAEEAIGIIFPNLVRTVINPTKALRGEMARGAYLAGKAINITKTTAPHAFSYPFTSHYGYPHGHAVAIVFPYIASLNLGKGKIPEKKRKWLLEALGADNNNLYRQLANYVGSIGLTVKDADYDIDLLLSGISLERLSNNPLDIDSEMATEILKHVLNK